MTIKSTVIIERDEAERLRLLLADANYWSKPSSITHDCIVKAQALLKKVEKQSLEESAEAHELADALEGCVYGNVPTKAIEWLRRFQCP